MPWYMNPFTADSYWTLAIILSLLEGVYLLHFALGAYSDLPVSELSRNWRQFIFSLPE